MVWFFVCRLIVLVVVASEIKSASRNISNCCVWWWRLVDVSVSMCLFFSAEENNLAKWFYAQALKRDYPVVPKLSTPSDCSLSTDCLMFESSLRPHCNHQYVVNVSEQVGLVWKLWATKTRCTWRPCPLPGAHNGWLPRRLQPHELPVLFPFPQKPYPINVSR